MRTYLILLAACAIAGCRRQVVVTSALPSGRVIAAAVTVDVDSASYARGSTVTLRMSNHTGDMLGYNACTRTVERHAGNGNWSRYDEEGRACTMILALLEPGMSRTERTTLPSTLPGGTYRLTLAFSPQKATPSGRADAIVASTMPFVVP